MARFTSLLSLLLLAATFSVTSALPVKTHSSGVSNPSAEAEGHPSTIPNVAAAAVTTKEEEENEAHHHHHHEHELDEHHPVLIARTHAETAAAWRLAGYRAEGEATQLRGEARGHNTAASRSNRQANELEAQDPNHQAIPGLRAHARDQWQQERAKKSAARQKDRDAAQFHANADHYAELHRQTGQ
ncbi:hypothetical protein FRC17_000729 [Serendipita sp. 399]|nr:hypothetical protein FRC17_000729 [Serendipita sp. 399]